MNKTKKESNQLFCPYAKHPTCPPDQPTSFAHLGIRAAYTLVAWFMLGKGITSGSSFFVSLSLFSLPLLMDYLKFSPEEWDRKMIKCFGAMVSGVWVIFGLIGVFGILNVEMLDNTLYIKISNDFIAFKGILLLVESIWYSIGVSVFLTVVDWLYNTSLAEREILAVGANESN